MAHEDDTDFELLAEYSPDVICRSGVDMKWRYVSPSSFDGLGWTPEEMVKMELSAPVIKTNGGVCSKVEAAESAAFAGCLSGSAI